MAKKINDFGRKIGGARKDIWRARALQAADLQEMNRAEQEAYGKKDYVWPRPNWQELIASGEDKWVCYWKNEVRKALPAGRRNLERNASPIRIWTGLCASERIGCMAGTRHRPG